MLLQRSIPCHLMQHFSLQSLSLSPSLHFCFFSLPQLISDSYLRACDPIPMSSFPIKKKQNYGGSQSISPLGLTLSLYIQISKFPIATLSFSFFISPSLITLNSWAQAATQPKTLPTSNKNAQKSTLTKHHGTSTL